VNHYDGPGRHGPGDAHGHGELSPAEAAAQIRFLEEEVALLRRKITESPRHVRILEQRLAESAGRLAQLSARNEKLTETLKEARAQLVALREEVDRLAQPPSGYGVFLTRFPDETVDVFTSGRRMRVAVSPAVEGENLRPGQTVRLNEALTVVEAGDFERTGEVCGLREVLSEPTAELAGRALVVGHADEERVVWLAAPLTLGRAPRLVGDVIEHAVQRARGTTTTTTGAGVLVGHPASAGRATGPVRIVEGPDDFATFTDGDILVAKATAPAWTPLFGRAAAVITDGGTLAAHASLIAREYGIPAVVGTGTATHQLQPGQLVTVDGAAGTVTVHDP